MQNVLECSYWFSNPTWILSMHLLGYACYIASRIMEAYTPAAAVRSTVGIPTVHYCKTAITGNICCSLYCHLTRQPVKNYLESRRINGPGTYDSIAWEAINKARGLRHNLDMQIFKLICNQLPTLQTFFCRKWVISDKCLFCKTKVKDGQHIYRCSHPVQKDQWIEELQKVALWLQNQSTEPGIWQMLIIMLHRWHKNPKPSTTATWIKSLMSSPRTNTQ